MEHFENAKYFNNVNYNIIHWVKIYFFNEKLATIKLEIKTFFFSEWIGLSSQKGMYVRHFNEMNKNCKTCTQFSYFNYLNENGIII